MHIFMHNSIFFYIPKMIVNFYIDKIPFFFPLGNAPWNVTAGFEQWDEVNIYIVF